MSRTYSSDLRERVAGQVNSGHSRRAVAHRFGVSPSFVVKLMQRVLETGSTTAAKRGRPFGHGKLAPVSDALVARVQAVPDATLAELALWLSEKHGVRMHPFSVSCTLQAAGFAYKKIAAGGGSWTRQNPTLTPCLAGVPPAPHALQPVQVGVY